jgi:hypothetical protein
MRFELENFEKFDLRSQTETFDKFDLRCETIEKSDLSSQNWNFD